MNRGCGIALQLSGWFTQTPATRGMEGTQSNTDAILRMAYGSLRRGQSSTWRELPGTTCSQASVRITSGYI